MAVLVTPTAADLLNQEAGQIAAANPPGRVLALVVLAIFTAIGWTIGRTWFFASKGVIYCALAVRYGYRSGMKIQVEPKRAV